MERGEKRKAQSFEETDRCLRVQLNVGGHRLLYINPFTSIISAVIIWAFVIWCIVKPSQSANYLEIVNKWVADVWTWLYIGTQDVWVLFVIVLYFSKYSSMKLGKDDDRPKYSDISYFALIFACGIGVGFFYYGVAEPIYHYKPKKPKYNRYWWGSNDNKRAQDAINQTLFHWGVHGWIVYVIIGLLLSFLCYRRDLPLTVRTCFHPMFGDRVFGRLGDIIDTLCIVCTMFGVCTSLGLGVMQLNAGFHIINSSIPNNTNAQLIIVWCVTIVATISVLSGIRFGIRRLSELCFVIGCLLLFIILFADKTWYLVNVFVQSVGYYFQWLIQLGFHTDAFEQIGKAPDKQHNQSWIGDWTIFYWGWWISWSPFVGVFIAKISRGRTIKEFITFTLILPSACSFFWFSVFGGVAIKMENEAVNKGMNCTMYNESIIDTGKYSSKHSELFAIYGTTMLSCRETTEMWFDVMASFAGVDVFLSVISIIALILFFVTSSDSASLVIDCLSANGNPEPPKIQRVFWSLTEGATASGLLVGGAKSLKALQTVSVVCGLPFTFVLNFTCIAMWRALREEAGEIGIDDGRWYHSLYDIDSKKRWITVFISIVAPWYRLTQAHMKLNGESAIVYQVIYTILYGVPFYLWIVLLIASTSVENISVIGWAILLLFFAFASGLRRKVRDMYGIYGNTAEDFFTFCLLYPLACMQIYEQVTRVPIPNDMDMVERNEEIDTNFEPSHNYVITDEVEV